MASIRGILNIQALNELTSENYRRRTSRYTSRSLRYVTT